MNKEKESDNNDWNIASSQLADKNLDWSFFEKGKKRPAEETQSNTTKPWTLNAHQTSQPIQTKDTDGFAMPARPPSILKKPKPQLISDFSEKDYQFEVPEPIETNDNDNKPIGPIDDEAAGLIGKLLGKSETEVALNVAPSDQHHYFNQLDDKSKQTPNKNNQNTQKKEPAKLKTTINVKPEEEDDELDDVFKMKQYEIEQYGPKKTEEQNDNAQELQPTPIPVVDKKKDKKAFKF